MSKKNIEFLDVLLYLQDKGVRYIQAHYSGGGDSGQIDDIEYVLSSLEEHEKPQMHQNIEIDKVVADKVEQKLYSLLDGIEDWYNNEGGWGTITVNISTGKYDIDNNVRIVESENYQHEGLIDE